MLDPDLFNALVAGLLQPRCFLQFEMRSLRESPLIGSLFLLASVVEQTDFTNDIRTVRGIYEAYLHCYLHHLHNLVWILTPVTSFSTFPTD